MLKYLIKIKGKSHIEIEFRIKGILNFKLYMNNNKANVQSSYSITILGIL